MTQHLGRPDRLAAPGNPASMYLLNEVHQRFLAPGLGGVPAEDHVCPAGFRGMHIGGRSRDLDFACRRNPHHEHWPKPVPRSPGPPRSRRPAPPARPVAGPSAASQALKDSSVSVSFCSISILGKSVNGKNCFSRAKV